jgi:hypothetical protein
MRVAKISLSSEVNATVIDRRYNLTVVADRQRWTNFHRALGSRSFGVVFRLLEKVNRRFVLIRLQKIGRFLQTGATHRAGHVHIPRSGNVQGLFACFVRHSSLYLINSDSRGNVFSGGLRSSSAQVDRPLRRAMLESGGEAA